MIRHISLFRMEPNPLNGRTMEENTEALRAYLEKLPESEPSILSSWVSTSLGAPPELPEEAPVMFARVIQELVFTDAAAAAAYGECPAHKALMKFSEGMVRKVAAIDYER